MARIKPGFKKEIEKFGAVDFTACYNCGNCTAVCSLSTDVSSFPREMVRCSTLGLQDDIKSSLKPWLCYYCGECTAHCPQNANPGELMMSLRRWLTAQYDWTGFSGLLYKSLALTVIVLVVTALGVLGFAYSQNFNVERIMHVGHLFEMIAIVSVFALILLPNLIRMWWYVIYKPGIAVGVGDYMSATKELLVHMFTQKRALGCDDNQKRWFEHLILVVGYLSLLFTTVFLDWFGSNNLFVILIGYVQSTVVFVVTFDFVGGRIKKKKEVSKHSQPSDWLFVIWLFLMGLTAFLVRLFIDLDIIESNLWIYLLHFVVLVQWAVIIVPFGKWTHFLYRSFAMYFDALLQKKNNS